MRHTQDGAVRERRRVSVICAPPNGRNPGMTSVDLAFARLGQKAGADEVTYWRLWDQSEWANSPGGSTLLPDGRFRDPDSGLTYRPLRGHLDEALDAGCVVFWGDFLHMAVYQRHNVDILTRRMGAYNDPAEASNVVARHLLLRGRPSEELDRVVSFGSTLAFNTASDYTGGYRTDLESFLSGVHRVWFRDAYSAQVAGLARAPRDELCKGLDAAFLLPVEPDPGQRGGTLGVFLGRSALPPESLARFGRRLAMELGLVPRWLPWGVAPAFWPMNTRRRFRAAWPGLEHELASPAVSARLSTYADAARATPLAQEAASTPSLLAELARHQVVLTDTYHVAINAWRVGTPAICVVDRPTTTWSVNSGENASRRDKREDLYSQLDALGLLVDGALLRAGSRDEARRVGAALDDGASVDLTRGRLRELVDQSTTMVVEAVRNRLDRA